MDRRRQSQDEVLLEKPKSYDAVDAFKSNSKDGMNVRISNLSNEQLIVDPQKFAIFESVKDAKAEATFCLHIYAESGHEIDGLPVAISCQISEKKYILEASNSVDDPLNSVNFLEKQLPRVIESKTSGLIFYLQEFSTGDSSFRFESSLHKGFCLAWNSEKKLILKRKQSIDEKEAFRFSENN
ncbi:interleukin-18-like [Eleutherodactylus coqui]|uniref:interleukin-18-like n=1 Tax=Eleutherodactylus coqui TaxID=57060 RepID=UPI003461D586